MRASVISAELAKALSELMQATIDDRPSALRVGNAEKRLGEALESFGFGIAEEAAMRVKGERR